MAAKKRPAGDGAASSDVSIGHNGGLPLEQRYSLSIAETSQVTGWPPSSIYEDLKPDGRLESYTKGRRRFVLAASVVRLIAELKEVTQSPHRHRRFGRNAPAKASAADEKTAHQRRSDGH